MLSILALSSSFKVTERTPKIGTPSEVAPTYYARFGLISKYLD